MAKFGIGQPVRRSEDPRFITGQGRYTDDITLPGQTYAVFLRSPVAHAEITTLDTAEAKKADGVIGVFTGDDLLADDIGPIPCKVKIQNRDGSEIVRPPRHALAVGRVRHVGEPIAMVVATSTSAARDAAELIELDFDTLPAVADMRRAVSPGAPVVWDQAPDNLCLDWELGDGPAVDDAFANAAHRVSLDLINNRVIANSMEGRACNADFDTGTGRLTFYVSSQGVYDHKSQIAKDILKMPEDKVLVRTTDVGGGFGMKLFMYPEYVAVAYAARKLGSAVKWTADRSEGFVSDDHGRDHQTHAELALDADGKFLAMKVDTLSNLGAYLSNAAPFVATLAGSRMLAGVYDFPAIHVHVRGVFTNTQPVDAYRGAGRPEACFVVERLVDKTARELGFSPADLRRRNFIRPDAMPYDTALGLTYDSGDFARNMDDAMSIADWDGFEKRRAAARDRGRLRGIGMSTYIEACAGGAAETARIKVTNEGRATLLIGTQSNGQGHETAYKQILSERLGLAPETIDVVQGDSDLIPTGGGTGGSRSIPVGGQATSTAAEQVLERARERAADMLEAAAADIEFADGLFTIVGTDRRISFVDVAKASAEETAFDESGGFKPPAATFPNGTHVCELEIDPETGQVEIITYTVVDDFGTVLNPLLVEGQVHGGIAQGMGQALLERTVFDDEGQLLTGSFMDYCMPRADHLPFVTFRYNEVPCTTNPLGIKGAGEAGSIGAPPAIINALVDALYDQGIRHIDMPATPEIIWRAARNSMTGLAAE
ncbi:xanthine dehydrogenase family protein molybdopterin-binding subunit [Fodinicurvata sp. EGI_FJ10296]|uniref:xanthine dehydrogenase family protein molybdopterin-binding subunit n=1 Tax=Fodinicurvata sp. EGI_FJ10296 TaxID=3231908 RepID=UPI00345457A9